MTAAHDDDETPEQSARRVRNGIGFDGSTDAYDGSNEPQLRDLTARERDVLCGLISDILGAIRNNTHQELRDVRGGQDWVNHLVAIRDVVDPRRV